jgi:hypothetical protein
LNGLNGQQPSVDQFGSPIPGNTLAAGNTPAGFATSAANTGTPVPAATPQAIGGGIAGVASKREQEGIKVYGDRTKYNEWEFVYDVTKDKSRSAAAGAVPQQQPGAAAPQQQPAAAAPQSAAQQLLQQNIQQQQQFQQQQQGQQQQPPVTLPLSPQ